MIHNLNMFERKFTNILACALLGIMLILAVASMWNDSVIMDESPHIAAGYSYLKYKDMRLNPEHPPLIKDIAALPLQFMDLKFPNDGKAWKENINDQWVLGSQFLYESGNNPDKIIFWGRIGPILIMLLLGFYIFKWTLEEFGDKTALMALTLYVFSPTILAHGRFVTTDIGATAGIFISIYYFVKFLRNKTPKFFILASLAFGFAILAKFSTFLLIPFLGLLALLYGYIQTDAPFKEKIWRSFKHGVMSVSIISAGFIFVVWPIYQWHTWNYPAERQKADTIFNLGSFGNRLFADPIIWMSDKPILRPFAQYGHGFLMVTQRATGGNTTYYLGEVSSAGWKSYFLIVYLIKEPLAKHIMILIAIYGFIKLFIANTKRRHEEPSMFTALIHWAKNNYHEVAMLGFIILYWLVTLRSNLNIGVRHIIPTFPFVYVLISAEINKWAILKNEIIDLSKFPFKAIGNVIGSYLKIFSRYALIAILLFWYAIATIFTFPYFLAYFNELIGGPKNGYRYVVDSNLDWGQDLKRLTQYVEKNKINKIGVEYFGGGSPRYYLGEKYDQWQSSKGPYHGYFAISATLLQNAHGKPAPGFIMKPEDTYSWLKDKKPITTIGHSIFVYRLD
ncbi:MAG: Tetratricopeptide repeat protein [Parcubacteria group bacterium GW2011_GWD2_38_12]|nr:MAG: Tetratricopeptide repeat protein [Parcubacteria group bacterium GW2011_GWC2_36_17]KKQ43918.1 MAG: Tetratricopeptide repeat protein [Parcubacteria group bacterium GW2011_GWE2_37_8]KKQ52848.1 MAG: Tetratricopeptide repeat protein [Parcubacteria group bacterium GW2011_GWD2_38_12]KKQ59051.1 MAG: Tetratricopeptide repeat protein [Parcubacteria group bacterium GW2011_GWC1_38_17]KKQ59666.1 MAG: Tetratricopeptide repeat protein [Parcubacteria group bacterium GW2011_GWD1_38_16]